MGSKLTPGGLFASSKPQELQWSPGHQKHPEMLIRRFLAKDIHSGQFPRRFECIWLPPPPSFHFGGGGVCALKKKPSILVLVFLFLA